MNSVLREMRRWMPIVVTAGALVVLLPLAAAAAGQEAAGWRPTYDLIMKWVNFLILVFVIVKFARVPLRNFFKQKEVEVSSEIEAMEAEKKAAEEKIAEARRAIEHRQERFEEIKARMLRQGKRRKQYIIEGARRESRLMIEAARHKVEGQIRQAHEKLREEMVDLAIDLAMKRLPEVMQESDNQKLLSRYLEAVEQQ